MLKSCMMSCSVSEQFGEAHLTIKSGKWVDTQYCSFTAQTRILVIMSHWTVGGSKHPLSFFMSS